MIGNYSVYFPFTWRLLKSHTAPLPAELEHETVRLPIHICSCKKWHFVNKLFAAHFIFPTSGLCGMFECTLRCLYHALCVRWRKSSREGDIISGCRRRAGNHSSRQEPRQGEEEESLCNWRSDVMVVFTLCLSGLRSWYLSYIRTQLPQHTRGPKLAHTRQQWSCFCSTCTFKELFRLLF